MIGKPPVQAFADAEASVSLVVNLTYGVLPWLDVSYAFNHVEQFSELPDGRQVHSGGSIQRGYYGNKGRVSIPFGALTTEGV